ncbi:hypothetical protein [Actinophytocola sp.]|jgi:hypothetical protein|uniref:hypothetical protein n=1 Tax=Actinophytocola sp. TaxID=1872138 RepID=UPI002ED81270
MLSDWWNGVELWVLGLAFPLQFALVMAVLAPVCLVVAWAIDRIVDHTSALFGPSSCEEPPIGTTLPADGEAPQDTEAAQHPEAAEDTEAEPAPPEPPAHDERVPAESSGR